MCQVSSFAPAFVSIYFVAPLTDTKRKITICVYTTHSCFTFDILTSRVILVINTMPLRFTFAMHNTVIYDHLRPSHSRLRNGCLRSIVPLALSFARMRYGRPHSFASLALSFALWSSTFACVACVSVV